MTKRYEFKFYDYDCYESDDDPAPYPVSSSIDATFDFQGGVTWDVILWQFCKFLESTGYEGVRAKIRLVDNYDFMVYNHLFTCIYEPEEINKDEDESSDDDWKEEGTFQDIKREVE